MQSAIVGCEVFIVQKSRFSLKDNSFIITTPSPREDKPKLLISSNENVTWPITPTGVPDGSKN